MSKDVMIGKILSSVFFVLGVILFVASFTTLYFYDAEENSVKTLTDGVVEVEKGNEGYRVYTKHSCEDLEIDIYYESLFDRGNLVWDKSCSGGLLEFRPTASGDWNYVGTITFEQYSQYTSEVKIDFNISASHEVMVTDREPIERGLGLRTFATYSIAAGGIFILVTKKSQLKRELTTKDNELFVNHLFASNQENATRYLTALKNHVTSMKISHTELFSSFDINKDGQIDHYELLNGFNSLGIEGLSPMDVNELVTLMDINGDGKINLYELGTELDKDRDNDD